MTATRAEALELRRNGSRDLGSVLDPRCNGLNLLRLFMASGVIFYHSFDLTGEPIGSRVLLQLLQNIFVDGFFVLSGFLIVGAWARRPRVATYLRHRFLRIYPAYFVCLIVTAMLAAPLTAIMLGESLTVGERFRYIGINLSLYVHEYNIGSTLAAVPYPYIWNGSLWTLIWEVCCYIAVLVLGFLGVVRSRWGIPIVFVCSWVFAVLTHLTVLGQMSFPLVLYRFGKMPLDDAGRFALTFAAGALIWHLQGVLVPRMRWIVLSAAVITASMWLPDYRIVAAPFLAYGLIALGALVKVPRLHLRNDISYGLYIYAFPVQQLLAAAGLTTLGVAWFGLLATLLTILPATLSWFCVEKPAMRLK